MKKLVPELDSNLNFSHQNRVTNFSNYKVKIRGSMSRIVSGELEQKTYDYWLNKAGEDDDINILLEPDDLEDYSLPVYANLFSDEYWDEIDHKIDHYGAVLGDLTRLWVSDENGCVILESVVNRNSFDDLKLNYTQSNLYELASLSKNEHIYIIDKSEYGESLEGLITDAVFDINKLIFKIVNIYGVEMVESITYDGTQVELSICGDNISTETAINIF